MAKTWFSQTLELFQNQETKEGLTAYKKMQPFFLKRKPGLPSFVKLNFMPGFYCPSYHPVEILQFCEASWGSRASLNKETKSHWGLHFKLLQGAWQNQQSELWWEFSDESFFVPINPKLFLG